MSYNDFKNDRERKKYFRSHNDLYLNKEQWIKTILVGLLTAIIAGILISYISDLFGFTSNLFYMLLGYAVAYAVVWASGVESKQMGILSAILTVVGSLVSVGYQLMVYYGIFGPAGIISYIIHDVYLLICIIIGCLLAYSYAS